MEVAYKVFYKPQLSDFPGGSVVKNLPANAEDMGLILMCQEDPMEMEMTTHSSILAWETP